MTREQLRVADYLGHILEAIERIGEYTEDVDEVTFLDNKMIQDAVLRNIEIIGEAARNIERTAPRLCRPAFRSCVVGYLHHAQPHRAWLFQGRS